MVGCRDMRSIFSLHVVLHCKALLGQKDALNFALYKLVQAGSCMCKKQTGFYGDIVRLEVLCWALARLSAPSYFANKGNGQCPNSSRDIHPHIPVHRL